MTQATQDGERIGRFRPQFPRVIAVMRLQALGGVTALAPVAGPFKSGLAPWVVTPQGRAVIPQQAGIHLSVILVECVMDLVPFLSPK